MQREENYFRDADGQPAACLTVPEQFLTAEATPAKTTPTAEVASAPPAPLTPNEAAAPEAAAPAPAPARNVPATGVQDPGDFGKTDVPVQLQNRCESATRGLGCGSRAERSVVFSRLT